MGVTATQGWENKLAIKGTSPVDGSAVFLQAIHHNIRRISRIHYNNGMTGERSRLDVNSDEGEYLIRGPAYFEMTPANLDVWLPYIGFTESADVWTPIDVLPEFYLGAAHGSVDGYEWGKCKVARAVLSGQSGGAVIMRIDVVGQTESPLSFPAVVPAVTADNNPYLFKESTSGLSLVSATRQMEQFELSIDNVIDVKFRNNMTPVSITSKDRIVMFQVLCPFTSSELDIYDAGAAGAAGSMTFTSGAMSALFGFAHLRNEQRTPTPERGKEEVYLPLNFHAYKSGSTPELTITNDATTP